jgi:hypothetical protein
MKSRFLLIQLLLLASFCSLSCERQLTLTEADKALFVRATDLKRYGYEFENIEKHESFRKRGFFDGAIEIEYDFSVPDDIEQIYLDVQITIEATPSDARTEQEAKKTAMLEKPKDWKELVEPKLKLL